MYKAERTDEKTLGINCSSLQDRKAEQGNGKFQEGAQV